MWVLFTKHIKEFFILLTEFFIASISFQFLGFPSLLTLPTCSRMPSAFSVRACSVFTVVVFNSQSDDLSIPACVSPMLALSLHAVLFDGWYALSLFRESQP